MIVALFLARVLGDQGCKVDLPFLEYGKSGAPRLCPFSGSQKNTRQILSQRMRAAGRRLGPCIPLVEGKQQALCSLCDTLLVSLGPQPWRATEQRARRDE